MWATWRSRSVGSRVTPRASAMSWVCAQVSMIRAVSVEPPEQLRPAAVAEPGGDGVRVDVVRCRGELRLEFLRVHRGLDGDLVEVGEVADLVGDVPAGRRGRRVPAGLVQAGHQGAGDGRLGGEIRGERGHVYGHGPASTVFASTTARTWPVLTCSPALARS